MPYHSHIESRSFGKLARGFTLVEMAIVLAIVALLLGGLLPTISGQMEQQRRTETRKYMDEVRDALLGYTITNNHLPCPDKTVPPDGVAEPSCTTPFEQVGTLPYNDLGVSNKDAYGKELGYAATIAFASSAVPFTLTSTGTLHVGTSPATSNLTSTAVAVIVSHGANWATETSLEELENTNGDANFVSKDFVQNGFDDLLVWLSPNTLFNRMVTAGKLP